MSKQHYFSTYKSPNICIVTTDSICYPPSPKRPKVEMPKRNPPSPKRPNVEMPKRNPPSPKRPNVEMPVKDNSPQNIDVSFLDDFDIDEIVECLNDCDGYAQNTARLKSIENNDDILEKDCTKSSFKIAKNIERNLLTKSMDNEEIKMVVQNIHKDNTNNTCIEKDIETSSNNYNIKKHEDVHIDKNDLEIFIPTTAKQPNEETYNTTNTLTNNCDISITHNVTQSIMENKTENNNTQEIEETGKKSLLKTEQGLDSTNKAPKPFNVDSNTEDKIGCNTVTKIVDKVQCEEINVQYSSDCELKNKHNHVSEVEKTMNTFDKNEQNKQFHNSHEVSKSLECGNFKNIDSSLTINNQVKTQEAAEKQAMLLKNDKPEPNPELLNNNLENIMFQHLHKKFCVLSLIHSGQYANIFKCKDSEDKHYAVKILKKKVNVYRIQSMWNKIQGDIPKQNLFCVYLIAGFALNNNWCYLTDYYPKNLKDVLKESNKNLHIDTIQVLAGQLVGAVTTLRNKNIVHSDINPSHILLDSTNSKLRLGGFDEAYYIEAANLYPFKGTPSYRPPEVILGYSAGYSLDVWSTALVLHEMATGMQLFGGCIEGQVLYKQICTLGNVPPQMLIRSRYRNKHFVGYYGVKSMVNGKNKIACTIQGAYFSHWTEGKDQKQISKDMQKIRQFIRLLDQMLVIYPEQRLPIEFAYSNPFIYRVFIN